MTESIKPSRDFSEYDKVLDARNMRGQWMYDNQLTLIEKDGPMPAGQPFVWSWKEVEATLNEMCDLVTDEDTARRNVSFINPGPMVTGTSHTILMGMQLVTPGEVAHAHRHSINALRFVVDGSSDLFTVVDGEKCIMETHDLILTPAYTWHDHHNKSNENKVWIDILDVPVLGFMRQFFFESYPDGVQPLHGNQADWASLRGNALRPAWEKPNDLRIPYRYAWEDVNAMLEQYCTSEGSPFDDVILHYSHPITGGSTLPTLDCYIQSLRPGFRGEKHRHTSSTVYYVVEGEGTTVVGDKKIHWKPRDSFVVPNWMWHHHSNNSSTSKAILFSTSDKPLLDKLGFYCEEPYRSFLESHYPHVPADLVMAQRGINK